jgi:hypothetical protein
VLHKDAYLLSAKKQQKKIKNQTKACVSNIKNDNIG